jgi:hypothetical protein
MSGELNLKYSATNKTILALILGQNRTTRWNGTAMAAIGTVADANWTAGMIALTEQTTQNNTKTATYSGDFPAGITMPGEYVVEFYLSTAAVPGSQAIGVQTVWWCGFQLDRPISGQSAVTITDGASVITCIYQGLYNNEPYFFGGGKYVYCYSPGVWLISTASPFAPLLPLAYWSRSDSSPIGAYQSVPPGGSSPTVSGAYPLSLTPIDYIYAGAIASGRIPTSPSTFDPTDTTQVSALKTNLGKIPATVGAGDIAENAIDAAALKADGVTKIQSGVWQAGTRSLTTFGSLANDVAAAVWAATSRTLSGFGALAADIWTYATRTITGGTITTYSGDTPQTGDAYARLGAPASASVSADVAAVKAKTDRIPNDPAAVGSAMTLQSAEREAIAAALLDLANTIDGKTLRQALRIIAAVLAGKVSGAGSGIETFRGLDDLHDRVVVTADITGNRTNVNYP